jgi:hypothetical protein
MAKLSTDQFAQQIKAKYPQYASVDNATLTQKMLAKYPQYTDKVETAPAPAQKPGILPRIASDIGQSFAERGQNVAQSKADVQSGKQSLFSGLLQSAGQAAGLIGDTLFSVGKEAVRSVAPAAIPAAKNVLAGIASSQPVQQAVQAGGEFAAKHPELSRDIGPVGNIASILPIGKAGQLAAKGVQIGADAAKSATVAAFDAGTAAAKKILPTAARATDKALSDAIEVTSPTLYKKDSIATMERAGQPGGVLKSGKLGTYKRAPTQQDINVAQSVAGVVSKKNGPLDNIASVNQEIGRTSDGLSKHFAQNKVPFNFEDLRGFMSRTAPSGSLKADPAAFSTYARVRENLLSSIYDTLKAGAKKSGNYGSVTDMSELWDARKVVDAQIEKELGATTFDSPQYMGVKAAARDFRDGFNRFIADNVANPGQMEQVNRMHEFLDAARSRGIDIPSEQDALNILRKQFGLTPSATANARAAMFQDTMTRLSRMYEARGNIAESNWRLMDKNAIQRWMKQNPQKAKLLEYGLGAAGVGLGGSILLGN